MTERLHYAFRAADRLPPHEQDELAIRILAEVLPDPMREADRMIDQLQREAAAKVTARLGPGPAARMQ